MALERAETAPVPESITLGEVIDRFILFESQNPEHRINSRSAYTSDVKKFQKYLKEKGITSLDEISSDIIKDHLTRTGFSQSTIQRKAASLRFFFGWAVTNNFLEIDGDDLIPKLSFLHGHRKETTSLTKQEEKMLIEEAQKKPRDKALVLLALRTGAQISEIVSLVNEDIIRENDKTIINFPGETRAFRARPITLDDETSEALHEHLINDAERIEKTGYLFNNSNGPEGKSEHLVRQGAWFIFKNLAIKAGITRPVSPGVLRKTAAVNFEGDPEELAEFLGTKVRTANNINGKKKALQEPNFPKSRFRSF